VATPGECVFRTTLAELANAPQLPAPTLLFVGEVVRMAAHATLETEAAWWTPESFSVAGTSIDLADNDPVQSNLLDNDLVAVEFGTQKRPRRGE
jgi:hypothetical protein